MTFEVILLPQAEQDVGEIFHWLHERSPAGAAAWYRRWLEVIDRLEHTAADCELAPEDSDHEMPIQHIIFKTRRGNPYRALFTIRGRTAYVMHVRGFGRDLLKGDELQAPD